MTEWHSYTPDGRELLVRREGGLWIVRCGTDDARSRSLDVALIEAIRADRDIVVHVGVRDYAGWIRAQAALIEDRFRPDD